MYLQNKYINGNAGCSVLCIKYGRIATISLSFVASGVVNEGDTVAILPEGFQPLLAVYAPDVATTNTRYHIEANSRNLQYYGAQLTSGSGHWMTATYITAY